MGALIIVESTLRNDSWVPEYFSKVTQILAQFGGKYLTQTGALELLEGDGKPQYCIVAQFNSVDDAKAFYHSEEYAPFKSLRQKGAECRILMVPI